MKKTLLLSLIIYGLVMAGIGARNGDFLLLAIPIIVYLGFGFFYEPKLPQLKIERSLSTDRVTPDQSVTITLTITNEGALLEEVYLVDIIPPSLTVLDGQTELRTTLPSDQTASLEYTVMGQRGLYRFSDVRIIVSEPQGLFTRQVTLSAPHQFLVLPEIVQVKQVAIRPPRTGVYSGLIPARQGGPGVEFFGVREYHPGDPLRWVNERASARHQQALFVNEFEQERVVDVGLILDARRQSDAHRGQEALFEYGVQAAATLADAFLDGGNRVGLFIYGRSLDWTFPGYGKVQRERIVRAMARAKQGEGRVFERLEHLPTRLFPVRSQLVLISPLLAEDAEMLIKLRARGYRLLIISPDPVTFEGQGLADNKTTASDDVTALATRMARVERALLLTKLRQAEIQVIDWPVEIPFHQVAHTALSRLPFQRGRAL
jgi:uncharacterized protein (DUF58 family)